MSTRGKAATTECCACHYIFPKPEMHKVSRTVGAGHQPGRQTNRYDRYGNLRGFSRSQGYYRSGRTVVSWYCSDCYAIYKRNRRRVTLVCLVLFAAFAIYVVSKHEPEGPDYNGPEYSTYVQSMDAAEPDLPAPEETSALLAAPEASSDTSDGEFPAGSDELPEQEIPEASVSDQNESGPPAGISPENTPALREAVMTAINTGQTQRWTERGNGGYAVVSSAEPSSGCHTLYFTVDTIDPDWTSPTETFCPD